MPRVHDRLETVLGDVTVVKVRARGLRIEVEDRMGRTWPLERAERGTWLRSVNPHAVRYRSPNEPPLPFGWRLLTEREEETSGRPRWRYEALTPDGSAMVSRPRYATQEQARVAGLATAVRTAAAWSDAEAS